MTEATADLELQLEKARRQIVSDGYDMSVGELINLYKLKELIINPEYQRLFRWSESQKTHFIESLLLGLPIPPIFVYQRADGIWELIDGLQRLSTILEFTGDLLDINGKVVPASVLAGTNDLPALAGIRWGISDEPTARTLPISHQLVIKRSRIRVEILKMESDEDAKFHLFMRLNTGGSQLTDQEVRNCALIMANPQFFTWLKSLAELPAFGKTVTLTEEAAAKQQNIEIALRHLAYRRVPYAGGLDVNDYLDKAARELAKMDASEREIESNIFMKTFEILEGALGGEVFKKWEGGKHSGPFLISGFDAIAHGVASNLEKIETMGQNASEWLKNKIRQLWSEPEFVRNSGMGVRGTTRLKNLLPFGKKFFEP